MRDTQLKAFPNKQNEGINKDIQSHAEKMYNLLKGKYSYILYYSLTIYWDKYRPVMTKVKYEIE